MKRLWSDHRNACLLILAIVVIGIVVSPWVLLAAVLPVGWVLLKNKPVKDQSQESIILEGTDKTTISSYQVNGIREIMFANCLIEKKDFINMSVEEIKELIDEKLLEESFQVFILEEDNFDLTGKNEIQSSIEFKEDVNPPGIDNENIRLIFWEELKETDITIDLEGNIDNIQLAINGNNLFDDIQDTYEAYVFTDYSTTSNGKELQTDLNSESYGQEIRKGLFLSQGANLSTTEINLNDYDELSEEISEFKEQINYQNQSNNESELTTTDESEPIRSLPKEWAELDGEEICEKIEKEKVDINVLKILSKATSKPLSDGFYNFYAEKIRAAVALCPDTPEDILQELRKEKDSLVSDALIERKLPAKWRSLDFDQQIENLRKEKNIEAQILNLLSEMSSYSIKEALALSPSSSKEILDKIKGNSHEQVISLVKERETLPGEWGLLDSSEKCDKLSNSENVNNDILNVLSQSYFSDVRYAVAANLSTPNNVLEKLKNDKDEDVRQAATIRLFEPRWQSYKDNKIIIKSLLKSKDTDIDLLKVLSNNEDEYIRRAVALNPCTPQPILDELSEDEEPHVQNAVRERDLPSDWQLEWEEDFYECSNEERLIEKIKNEDNITKEVLETLSGCSLFNLAELASEVLSERENNFNSSAENGIESNQENLQIYILDYSSKNGCISINYSNNINIQECETYVKSLRVNEGDNDYFFIPELNELILQSNTEWVEEDNESYRLYTTLKLDLSNSYKTDRVKQFLNRAIEEEMAITVEIGLKYNNKDLDFEPEEDFEGYLETE